MSPVARARARPISSSSEPEQKRRKLIQREREHAPPGSFPPDPAPAAGEGIALIELFAGLRTARYAAVKEGMRVVAHLSAETDAYANAVARRNFHDDSLHGPETHVDDVRDLSEEAFAPG